MHKKTFFLAGVLLTLLSRPVSIYAQISSSTDEHDEIINLRPYTVTGGLSLGDPDATILPVSSLEGRSLDQLQTSTLGGTLEMMPGIQSTAFAGGASRPIIRGFSGPRIQILQEGLVVADVSADSPDHAANVTPEFADSIDVIRGPATLLYGGSAVGGVVNVVGSLFPQLSGKTGTQMELSSRYYSVNRGWKHQAMAAYQGDGWIVEVFANDQDFGDYDIPGYASSGYEIEANHSDEDEEDHEHDEGDGDHEEDHDHEDELEQGRLSSSFSESKQYRVAFRHEVSEIWQWAGSVGDMQKAYGVPGHVHVHEEDEAHDHEEDSHEHEDEEHEHEDEEHEHEGGVSIDMKQQHLDLELLGNWKDGLIRGLKLRVHASDYEHSELEGDEVATFFDKQLLSARFEILNQANDQWSGVSGMQWNQVDYRSEGEEALIPDLDSSEIAVFTAQNYLMDWGRLHGGARWERVEYDLNDHSSKFSDDLFSVSAGISVEFDSQSMIDLVFSNATRAPSSTELYADGLHAATRGYEVGDGDLEKEVSRGVDLRYSYETNRWHWISSVYYNRFENYIFANPTGDIESGFSVYQYEQQDAEISGLESEFCWKVLNTEAQRLELSLIGDVVNSNLLDSEERLPRVPAKRLGMTLLYQVNRMSIRGDYRHYFAVDDVAENEFQTDAYDVLNVFVDYPVYVSGTTLTVSLAIRNLLDEAIRPHTSYLKDLAPQPGRGIELGMRWVF